MSAALDVAPLNVGVIGVGVISTQYFAQLAKLPNLRLVAVADLDTARASAVAAEQGALALGVDDLLTDPRVDAVLNLAGQGSRLTVRCDGHDEEEAMRAVTELIANRFDEEC